MDTVEIRELVEQCVTDTKFTGITRKYFMDILCGVSDLTVRNCTVRDNDREHARVTLVYAQGGVLIAFRLATYSKLKPYAKTVYKQKVSWRDKI